MQNGRKALVLGGGIVGSTLALALQTRGWTVTLVDPGVAREAASYGNAGSLAVGEVVPLANPSTLRSIPKMLIDRNSPLSIDPAYLFRLMPWLWRFARSSLPGPSQRTSHVLAELLSMAIDDYDRLTAELGLESLRQRNNSIRIYRDRDAYEIDAAIWDVRKRLGVEFHQLDTAALRKKVPAISSRYRFGVEVENYQTIRSPGELVQRIRNAFGSAGGRFSRTRVSGIRVVSASEVVVTGPDGVSESANQLVVAAGAWSNRLTGMIGERFPLETERGYHAQLAGPSVELDRAIGVRDQSIVLAPVDGGMRISGFVEFAGLEKAMDVGKAETLIGKARTVFPELAFEGVEHWMGHRPSLPDCLPIVGRSSIHKNVYYNLGHAHLGLTLGPTSARLLADLMEGDEAPILRCLYSDRFGRRTIASALAT